jgi:1,4-dihydroxy-6-naphthoate synthase
MTAAPLSLAYSPCPNDTFIFTAWVEGHLPGAPEVVERLDDIDVLNAAALAGEADIVKMSFHAYGHVRDRYCLLRSGGALGRGCGPLVVAREPLTREALAECTVAIPGTLTTAALLLRLWQPLLPAGRLRVMRFDEILPAVRDGVVDAGLIIHESRFTYHRYGLTQVVDLDAALIRRTQDALAASVAFAYAHTDVVWPTVRRHAQEMEDDVMRQHIDLYVNAFTRDYGAEGEAAIRHLLATAEKLAIIPPSVQPLFI